jgi:hypothetical protein
MNAQRPQSGTRAYALQAIRERLGAWLVLAVRRCGMGREEALQALEDAVHELREVQG